MILTEIYSQSKIVDQLGSMLEAGPDIIHIDGMMCSHCEASVKAALEALPGVVSATASHEKGIAEAVLEGEVSEADMRSAIEAEDYTVLSFE